jgi:hypothetical protein
LSCCLGAHDTRLLHAKALAVACLGSDQRVTPSRVEFSDPLIAFVSLNPASWRAVQVRNVAGEWREVAMSRGIKALVVLNLQSYAGGRDLWGLRDPARDAKKGWKTPIFNDGVIEVRLRAAPFGHDKGPVTTESCVNSLIECGICTLDGVC